MEDKSKKLGLLALRLALLYGGYEPLGTRGNSLRPEDIDVSKKELPIPKGCRRYYYDKNGLCEKGNHIIYFDAMKPKSAYKKYMRWLNTTGAS